MNYKLSFQKSDTIGVLSSGLCMIHCLATPFFFDATVCSNTCCNTAPLWCQWLDYIFLVVSIRSILIIIKCVKFKYSLLVSLTYSIPTQDVCLLIVLFHAYHV